MPGPQHEYKDRLFGFIFGREEHKEWTLSLYNAINGSNYDDPSQIVITTIREVLYMGMHNDVSFMISDEMNLYEQQSTYNPNMPLRMLQYAGNLYENELERRERSKYGHRLVPLPVPRLVVFYNGLTDEPDETVLRLSDAFPAGSADKADIEVRVRMVNVNRGHSGSLMARCPLLEEYAWAVDAVRQKDREMPLEAAIDQMITTMPGEFIIKPYLEQHRAEVKGMLLTEYNEAKEMERLRKEYREEFLEEGRAEGRVEGERIGETRGIAKLNRLLQLLTQDGRTVDFSRILGDETYRSQLFEAYGLT
ncbi:MAG: hypothetical protein IKP40_04180 [Clostridia bacterium]|nr:hypothetical protein [Clostridia bacterium]